MHGAMGVQCNAMQCSVNKEAHTQGFYHYMCNSSPWKGVKKGVAKVVKKVVKKVGKKGCKQRTLLHPPMC